MDPLPARIFFLPESSFSWASTASLPLPKKKKKMELFVWESPDTPNEQALARLQLDWKGRVARGMVLKLCLLSKLTFYRGIFGVTLMRGNLMKTGGS